MDLDYSKDREIDKYNLDFECMDQPRRFSRWGELKVEAETQRDYAKQRLGVIRAKVLMEVQEEFASGKRPGKGTESMVKAVVDLDLRVQGAEQELIEAVRQVGLLGVAKESFHDRKKELENLVQLWLSSYWADPKIPQKREWKPMDLEEARQQNALDQNMRLGEL